jgi:hypothetical protein
MVYWNVLFGRLTEAAEKHHETPHSGQTERKPLILLIFH